MMENQMPKNLLKVLRLNWYVVCAAVTLQAFNLGMIVYVGQWGPRCYTAAMVEALAAGWLIYRYKALFPSEEKTKG